MEFLSPELGLISPDNQPGDSILEIQHLMSYPLLSVYILFTSNCQLPFSKQWKAK